MGRTVERAQIYWRFFFGMLLSIPLLAIPWLWRDRDTRLLISAAILFFIIALSFQVWHSPHYAAPATGLFALIVTLGLRRLRQCRWGRWPIGFVVVVGLPITLFLSLILQTNARDPDAAGNRWAAWHVRAGPRATARKKLMAMGEKHLVMVRYSPPHDVTDEWVYNEADMNAAQIVWAREMGPFRDGKLMRHFAGRRIWLAEPDANPPRISPIRWRRSQIPANYGRDSSMPERMRVEKRRAH